MKNTNEQIAKLVKAIGTAIKDAGAVPSGHLYAILSQFGCTEQQYTQLIDGFKNAGKVREANNLLYWVE